MKPPILTEDQVLLRDVAQRFLRARYDFRHRSSILTRPYGHDPAIWQEFGAMGWLGLIHPDEHGGAGGDAVDLFVLMREFGAALVVEPYLASVVLAGIALRNCGTADQIAELLPGIVDGSHLCALAFAEPEAGYDCLYQQSRAVAQGGTWRLSGRKSVVLGADVAETLIIVARSSGMEADAAGISMFLVRADAPGVTLRRYRLIDGRGAAEIQLQDAPGILLGEADEAAPALQEALRFGCIAAIGEAVGVMDAALAVTTEYLNTREQFGRKIASFQALRHRVADMFVAREECNALGFLAAAAEGGAPPRRIAAIAGAKAYAGSEGRRVCEEAVQMHGAIAITDEYVVGHYLKRILVLDRLFGPVDHQMDLYVANSPALNA